MVREREREMKRKKERGKEIETSMEWGEIGKNKET